MSELGLCGKCGKSTDCLNTSHGWMCRPCFGEALKVPSGPDRLYVKPPHGKKVFVIKEPPNTFVTIAGTLYAFERKVEADEIADGLKGSYAMKVFVEEVDAMDPLLYVLDHPELRLIGLGEKSSGKRDPGPGEFKMPAL